MAACSHPVQPQQGLWTLQRLPPQEISNLAEIKREVRTIEVTYQCDACGQGMMAKTGDMDKQTGDIEHRCMICDHAQMFQWQEYPRYDHIGLDEKI